MIFKRSDLEEEAFAQTRFNFGWIGWTYIVCIHKFPYHECMSLRVCEPYDMEIKMCNKESYFDALFCNLVFFRYHNSCRFKVLFAGELLLGIPVVN